MNCEICQREIGEIVVLLPIKRPDGALDTLACLECAKKSSAYCLKHERPHLGFEDGTTACTQCTDESVVGRLGEAEAIFSEIKESLPPIELGRLTGYAKVSGRRIGCSTPVFTLVAISTKALRLGLPFEEVKKRVLEAKSVDLILS